jgi:glycosyltransferase involved in cell wall biosynthesis
LRIAITSVQVPFLAGGAEAHAEGLKKALAARGHPVELITHPFRFFPPAEVERAMRLWESEDLTRLNLYEPDRVICLKFPSYGAMHPSKVLWLLHQHRAAYELFDVAGATDAEHELREQVKAFDDRHIGAIAKRFANSRRVAARLKASNNLDATALYHPPPMASQHYTADAQPYVLVPSRVERDKRQELVVRAMREVRGPGTAVFAGEGGQIGAMRELAAQLGVEDRVRFLGRVPADELLGLYAHAAAICFPPLDEDLGYVTLEAMLSAKPVITCDDSGGPLEFVVDGETGHVVAPRPTEIARAIERVLGEPARAAAMGRAGRALYAKRVPTWDQVVDTLLAERHG